MKKYILYFILFICFSQTLFSQTWQQIIDFPSTERDDGTAFIINNKAYCGTGQKPFFISTNDFYSLDMNTDIWDTIAFMPGSARQYASSFSYANWGFVMGGYNGASYFNDLWRYDAMLNTWVSKTSLPAAPRMGCACFVINGIAYIVGGRTSTAQSIKEVWAYDIVNDTWQQKNDLPFGARWRSASVEQNNKGYLIFGRDENNHFRNELLEYNPLLDSWTQLSVFPDVGRTYSSLVSFSDDLIFLTGLDSTGNNYNDMWRINTDTLIWQQLDSIPSTGRRGGICFNSSSSIYYTCGVTQNGTRLKETWKIENPTGIIENADIKKISSYPNPADQFINLTLESPNNTAVYIEIMDNAGRIIQQEKTTDSSIKINSGKLANGLYTMRISTGNKIYYSKVVVLH